MRAALRARRDALVTRAVADGPDGLVPSERAALLRDPASADALHDRVWAEGGDAWRR